MAAVEEALASGPRLLGAAWDLAAVDRDHCTAVACSAGGGYGLQPGGSRGCRRFAAATAAHGIVQACR
jgi:hypothetical protein